MSKASKDASILFPYLLPMFQRAFNANGGGSSSGTPGVGGVPNPHNLNSGYHTGTLSNIQFPQGLLVDGTRTLTGNLNVAAGVTIDGVDLGVFKVAYDLHVADPDAHHDHATTTGGLDRVDQLLFVDEAYPFEWTGVHSFNQDIQLDADLDFIGAQQITTSAGNLTLNPFADLILPSTKTDRSSDYADGIPIAGYSFHINSGSHRQLTTHTIKADELHVRVFIADTVRVDIGEEYWGKSMGIVYADFATSATIGGNTTVIFEDSVALTGAIFANNDWLMISTVDIGTGLEVNQIWGQVSGYTDLGADANGVGRQSWVFTLRSGPTSWPVKKGRLAVDFGVSGQGYVHLSTLTSADGPWIQIGTWAGANPYTPGNRTIRTQIGNLDSISDPDFTPTGYGLYSENAYLKGVVRTVETLMDDDGLALEYPSVASSSSPGAHAQIVWWPDIDSKVGTPAAYLAAWKDTSVPATPVDVMYLQVTKEATSTASAMVLVATGSPGAFIYIDSRAAITLSAIDLIADGHFRPQDTHDADYDLGTALLRWRTLYVDNIVAATITGTSLGGQTWTYPASMTVDAVNSGDTQLNVINSGAGRADLVVDRNISLGGTVDGVDLSALDTSYAAHIANPAAHHALATGGTGITVTGQSIAVNSVVALSATDMIAGAGLTGGGTLASNRTFNVGAGPGITVNADTVEVNLAVNSGLNKTSGLAIDASLAGAGLTLASGVLSVNVALGLAISGDNVVLAGTVAGAGLDYAAGVLSIIAADGLAISGDTVVLASSAAGAGLGYAAGVLAVNAGVGIAIVSDTVAISLGTNSGLNTTSGLVVDPTLAGAGMTMATGVINVIAGDASLVVTADEMHVNLSHTYVWSGNQTWNTGAFTFNTDLQLGADLDFVGARSITTSTGDLTIDPAGLIILPNAQEMKTATFSDLVTGIAGMRFWDRGSNYRQLTIGAMKMDELYARVFVADETRIDRGEEYWSKSYGVVETDFTLPADEATVNVWFENATGVGTGNIFSVGDYLLLRSIDWTTGIAIVKVWFTVTALVTAGSVDGYRQQWTIKRETGGTTGLVVKKGNTVLDAGQIGQGWIHLSALSQDGGPFIQIGDFTSVVSSDTPVFTNRVRMGNLKGTVDYGAVDTWGFVAGNNIGLTPATGFSGLSAEATNGLRLFNTPLHMYDGVDFAMKITKEMGIALRMREANSLGLITWYDDLDDMIAPPGDANSYILSYRDPSGIENHINRLLLVAQGGGTTGHQGQVYLGAFNQAGTAAMQLKVNPTNVVIASSQGTIGEWATFTPTEIEFSVPLYTHEVHALASTVGLYLFGGADAVTGPYISLIGKDVGGADDGKIQYVATMASSAVGDHEWYVYDGSTHQTLEAIRGATHAHHFINSIVNHGITTIVPNNAWAVVEPVTLAGGGLKITAVTDTDHRALWMKAILGTTNPADDTPAFALTATKQNGTGEQALASLETVLNIYNSSTLLFSMLGSGLTTFTGGISFGQDTLSQYDQQTWTPAITGSTTNPTVGYASRDGTDTRIGNVVFFNGQIVTSSSSGGSGDVRVSLPVTAAAHAFDDGFKCSAIYNNIAYTFLVASGQAYGTLRPVTSNTNLTVATVNGLGAVVIDYWGHYYV